MCQIQKERYLPQVTISIYCRTRRSKIFLSCTRVTGNQQKMSFSWFPVDPTEKILPFTCIKNLCFNQGKCPGTAKKYFLPLLFFHIPSKIIHGINPNCLSCASMNCYDILLPENRITTKTIIPNQRDHADSFSSSSRFQVKSLRCFPVPRYAAPEEVSVHPASAGH